MKQSISAAARAKYNTGKLNAKRITMKQVNEAIGAKYPGVFLVKGKGYYYIASDEDKQALYIASLYQTSVYVSKLNQLTVEQWVSSVDALME